MYLYDDGFFASLRSIVRSMHALADSAMLPYGITHAEVSVLLLLYADGDSGCSQDSLHSRLPVDRTNIGRSLKRLEELGYVSRERTDADRRAKWIYLTARGLELRDPIFSMKRGIEERARDGIAEGDYRRLSDVLRIVAGNLG